MFYQGAPPGGRWCWGFRPVPHTARASPGLGFARQPRLVPGLDSTIDLRDLETGTKAHEPLPRLLYDQISLSKQNHRIEQSATPDTVTRGNQLGFQLRYRTPLRRSDRE
jgi:hypothetical protein